MAQIVAIPAVPLHGDGEGVIDENSSRKTSLQCEDSKRIPPERSGFSSPDHHQRRGDSEREQGVGGWFGDDVEVSEGRDSG